MTTLKQEAQIELLERKLQDMQEQLAEMKRERDADVIPYSAMLPDNGCFFLSSTNFSASGSGDCLIVAEEDQNVFHSKAIAECYADAFRVILELRRCEGSGMGNCDNVFGSELAWCLDPETNGCVQVFKNDITLFSIFPPFPTEALAEAAIERVGLERILNAMKRLANYDA